MRVSMRRCDNATCKNCAYPEGSRTPPYGWFKVNAYQVGHGTNLFSAAADPERCGLAHEFCSKACVLEAIGLV